MQNYYGAGGLTGSTLFLRAVSLFLWGRGNVVYLLPSSDPILALLLMGFTDDDDDDPHS
ncbi:hypothetical protein Hanom_Chr07g00639211 [Helianthus anomalus]